MSDRLTDMRVFHRVARLGSFVAAAREMGLSNTAVSRRVSDLEADLGVQLLVRTTRSLRLTDAGRAYRDRGEDLVAELDALDASVAGAEEAIRGRVRIAAGVAFAEECLVPLLPALLERHPALELELRLSDSFEELVASGVDVAVRVGSSVDSAWIRRRLGQDAGALCAAPGYLSDRPAPGSLRDLAKHSCLIDTNRGSSWSLEGPDGPVRIQPDGPVRVNSPRAIRDAACAGLGIAFLPGFMARQPLATGALVRVLPDHCGVAAPVDALYPERRYLSARVRLVLDHLAASIGAPARHSN